MDLKAGEVGSQLEDSTQGRKATYMRPNVRKAGFISVFGAEKNVSFEMTPKAGKELDVLTY